uniref:NADH dehydrogenase [ubiquinone] 1 beta subcomplex subunit 7 n=1 Tax=Haptolina ericina TaxID=156174 RepID=A0A6T9HKM8_9EUKA
MEHGTSVSPVKEKPLGQLQELRERHEARADLEPPEMKVTREQMRDARVPLHFRDYCAHILIPLNECRHKTWFAPYKCTDLRHAYEKCQYDEFQRRVRIAQAEREDARAGGDE